MKIEKLIQKYDINIPRYTSYPTANYFSDNVNSAHYQRWLPIAPENENVSIYIHIPFCKSMCRYCGCHTKMLPEYEPARIYVEALRREIESVAFLLGERRKVSFIHWGGGTPTFLNKEDMSGIMETISSCFDISDDCEHAIEIDPRTMTGSKAEFLADIGINRASLGVQDFAPEIQEAVGRVQPFEMVKNVCEDLRSAGISSINFDMIYGLPLQTEETIRSSMKKATELRPDRLAVFGYAHVPWFKKNQEQLEQYGLPDVMQRYKLYETAGDTLTDNGYTEAGIDHFVLPEDSMCKALESKNLHRNFQGYTTDECNILLGFGASAISKLHKGYLQNTPLIKGYRENAEAGLLAASRGIKVKNEDRIRAKIIENIMCYREADFSALEESQRQTTLSKLAELEKDGIAEINGTNVKITPQGKAFVRLVCTAFDGYWSNSNTKHAKAV